MKENNNNEVMRKRPVHDAYRSAVDTPSMVKRTIGSGINSFAGNMEEQARDQGKSASLSAFHTRF